MSDISEALDDTAAQSASSNGPERLDGPDREPKWKGLLEWLGVFVVAFVVFALIRVFVVSPFVVPSGSMEPTILVGDQVFAQRVSAHLGDTPEVGDIVVFKNPVSDSSHEILVKRVVARAGQTIDMIDGQVYGRRGRLEGALCRWRELPATHAGSGGFDRLPVCRSRRFAVDDGGQP